MGIARFQVTCYAATYSAVRNLANIVRSTLHAFKGDIGTVHIDAILFIDEYDMFNDDIGIKMIPIDFRVIHKEDN
jgi:hypothetical protein